MDAEGFEAQEEKTALEGLIDRLCVNRLSFQRALLAPSQRYTAFRMTALEHSLLMAGGSLREMFAPMPFRDWPRSTFRNLHTCGFNVLIIGVGPYQNEAPEMDARTEKLTAWAKNRFRDMSTQRRRRQMIASPQKFLAKLMSDIDRKAGEWSYARKSNARITSDEPSSASVNRDGRPHDIRYVDLYSGITNVLATDPPPAKLVYLSEMGAISGPNHILKVIDAILQETVLLFLHELQLRHRKQLDDMMASATALAASWRRQAELSPTPSQPVTPRTARPTRRHLCVTRRLPTADRAIRRARLRAAPLAAPTPHSAARASEIRTRSSSLRRSPAWRPGSGGGARTSLIAA